MNDLCTRIYIILYIIYIPYNTATMLHFKMKSRTIHIHRVVYAIRTTWRCGVCCVCVRTKEAKNSGQLSNGNYHPIRLSNRWIGNVRVFIPLLSNIMLYNWRPYLYVCCVLYPHCTSWCSRRNVHVGPFFIQR